jgi:hypothetical protein
MEGRSMDELNPDPSKLLTWRRDATWGCVCCAYISPFKTHFHAKRDITKHWLLNHGPSSSATPTIQPDELQRLNKIVEDIENRGYTRAQACDLLINQLEETT